MRSARAIVVGAGIGGLTAAADLARAGLSVTVLERAAGPGGRMRRQGSAEAPIDAGPTVFTMRWVFDALFEDAGRSLEGALDLERLDVLARHHWQDGGVLDLFENIEHSADAIGRLCGAAEADGYRRFARDTKRVFDVLDAPFMRAQRPDPVRLTLDVGLTHIADLIATRPFDTLWKALGDYFQDPRLRQLFGRYATYCGANPFAAPATLMLIAHAERAGVWRVKGGMYELALALERLGRELGAQHVYDTPVARLEVERGRVRGVVTEDGERHEADLVVFNGDAAALMEGLFGPEAGRALGGHPPPRSLSAVTFTGRTRVSGFPLAHHSVLFSRDYAAEFDAIDASGRPAKDPTVYICAQDRADDGALLPGTDPEAERLLLLVNARADGDARRYDDATIEAIREDMLCRLWKSGLALTPTQWTVTTPADFEQAFPATGGALYGRAIHGFMASFQRPGARTKIPNLYLAGGSAHPGAGVPMVATSGRLAAAAALTDLSSMSTSIVTATSGGTSTG